MGACSHYERIEFKLALYLPLDTVLLLYKAAVFSKVGATEVGIDRWEKT